jgi:biotin carboxylase
LLAITTKYTTSEPHYIEIGHYEPSVLSENIILKIKDVLFRAFDLLGLENGAFHSEIIIDDKDEVFIIEIGARMGGDCIGSDLVYISTGYDYMKMVIDVACGNDVECNRGKNGKNEYAIIRFIMSEEDDIMLRAFEIQHPEWLYRKYHEVSTVGGKICSSVDRFGYYIFSMKSKSDFDVAREYLFAKSVR